MQTQYASTQTNQKAILHSLNRSAQIHLISLLDLFSFCCFKTPHFVTDSLL